MSQQQLPPIEDEYSSESGGLMSRLSSWIVTLVVCSTSAFLTAGLISSFTDASKNTVKKEKTYMSGVSYELPARTKSLRATLAIEETPQDYIEEDTPQAYIEEDTPQAYIEEKKISPKKDDNQKFFAQDRETQETFAKLVYEKQEPIIKKSVAKTKKKQEPKIQKTFAKARKVRKKIAKEAPTHNSLEAQTQYLINQAYSTSLPVIANERTMAELSPLTLDYKLRFIPTKPPRISPNNILAQRVEAGKGLMKNPGGGYSIQIMRVSEATIGNVNDFIHKTGLTYMTNDLYMFPLKNKQYLIYYGHYDRAKKARKALAKLPEPIQKSGAFIIQLQTIRAKVIEQKPQRQIVTYRQNIS
ncbi:MAG: hypothetical protein HQL71_02140 [Magnetococcales bacterium]|nr:hypothetical protein [Magnetococcales bacterium]